jgi:hypothetical protein
MSSASSSLVPQFLSKNAWSILGITALFHFLAAVVLHHVASFAVLGIVGVVVFLLTMRRLEVGLCIALFEIVVGAHGHLVTLAYHGIPLSLRMVIFLAVMGGWLVGVLQRKWHIRFVAMRDVPFLALVIAVFYGVLRGVTLGNDYVSLLDDANSFVVLAYLLPLASVVWNQEHKRLFLTTFFTGVLWISLFTFALTYVFTHISPERIWDMYVLVRDTRMFEVTLLSGPVWMTDTFYGGDWFFRVFSQAHIFAPIYLLLLTSCLLFLRHGKEERVPIWMWVWYACFFGAFLQSLSRSFLVGFAAGGVTLFGFWLLGGKTSWQRWGAVARKKLAIVGSFLLAAGMLWVLISFPFPQRPDLTTSPFYRGDHDNTRALAVSSRWNMLDPLMEAIATSPTFGLGFGKELAYISDDPRIREMTGGTGALTTYRFEWGFLDVWLKMGVLGIVAYAWIFTALVGQVLKNIRTQGFWSFTTLREHWLEIGLASGVVFLFVTHVFTPYLNHPIGLFFLLLVAFFLQWRSERVVPEQVQTNKKQLLSFKKLSVGAVTRER